MTASFFWGSSFCPSDVVGTRRRHSKGMLLKHSRHQFLRLVEAEFQILRSVQVTHLPSLAAALFVFVCNSLASFHFGIRKMCFHDRICN